MEMNMNQVEQWALNDFAQYFSGETRLLGGSDAYKKIGELAAELREIESQPISDRMVEDRTEKIQELMEAAQSYVDTHMDPRTSSGKERRDIAAALKAFCENEKKYTDLADNVSYFRGKTLDEMKQGVNFREIGDLQREMDRLTKLPMTEERVSEYSIAMNRLLQASEVFLTFQPEGTMLHPVKEREEIQRLQELYRPQLDGMRDLRVVRRLVAEGKSWDALGQVREAACKLEGAMEIVGANVSQRIKMTYNGKKGFFTEKETVVTMDQMIDRTLGGQGNETTKSLIRDNREFLTEHYNELKKSYTLETAYHVEACKVWDQMEPSPQKDMLREFLLSPGSGDALKKVTQEYQRRLKEVPEGQLNDFKRMQLFDQTVHSSKLNGEMTALMTVNGKALRTYAETAQVRENGKGTLGSRMELEDLLLKDMLKADMQTEAGRETYEARKALLHDEMAKTEVIAISQKVIGLELATGESGNLKYDDELSGRNVASSRIAELLGVGHLLAHSEKMTVEMPDGRKMEGCFMEFAEGIDLRNGGEMTDRQASSINFTRNAGFTKDACSIEVLDYLCAQGDRHGGNMFVKLGEPNADGTRDIVGIQGIDNDLAFTTLSLTKPEFAQKQGTYKDLYFIDEALAERVKGLTRDKLEAAVGDILNPKEMEALAERVERMQKHIDEQMIQLKGDEWNLDANTAEMGEKGKRYEKAKAELDKSMTGKFPWERKHKDGQVLSEVNAAKARYAEAQKKEAEILEGVSNMFEAAEAEAAERTAREAKFDQILKASSKEAPAKTAEEKTVTQRTEAKRCSISDLEGEEKKQRASGIRIGSHRERAQQLREEKEKARAKGDDGYVYPDRATNLKIGAHRAGKKG